MRRSMISLMGLLLATGPALAQTPAVIDGWGNLKFGMTVAEAKAASDIAWNTQHCTNEQDIALRGCVLRSEYGESYGNGAAGSYGYYKVAIDGMRFEPELTFDRWGRLVHIALSLSESVPPTTCRALFGRTLDNLVARYGTFMHAPDLLKEKARLNFKPTENTTPSGNKYFSTDNILKGYPTSSDIWTLVSDADSHQESQSRTMTHDEYGGTRSYVNTHALAGTGHCTIHLSYTSAALPAPQTPTATPGRGF